jgi:hypothetical protein
MTTINRSARVGVITDQAGALPFMGIAQRQRRQDGDR